jgi:hypothetical protein
VPSKNRYVWVTLLFAVGCSSDNGTGGVDPNEQLSALTPAQATSLCDTFKSEYPEKTVDCGSDGSETIGYGSDGCGSGAALKLPPPSCTETVGQAADCLAALYAGSAVCDFNAPPACAALADPNCD